MMKYTTRVIQLIVMPEDDAIFSESATVVAIEDDAAGEYVSVKQESVDEGCINITPEEWPELRNAIDRMIAECRSIK